MQQNCTFVFNELHSVDFVGRRDPHLNLSGTVSGVISWVREDGSNENRARVIIN